MIQTKASTNFSTSSGRHTLRVLHVLVDLVEVQVLVDRRAVFVHHTHGFVVFGHRGDVAQLGRDRGQLGTGQEHVGVLAQAVGEVARAGGDHPGALAHLRLVAHAQRAAGHLGAGTGSAEIGVVAFLDQFALVHLGRWGDPQLDRDVACPTQQLGGRTEVTDVGHARNNEGLVYLGASELQSVVELHFACQLIQRVRLSKREAVFFVASCYDAVTQYTLHNE